MVLERTVADATEAVLTELRHEVAGWARAVGFDEQTLSDVVLAAYEAMTNIVDHAYPPGQPAWLHLVARRRETVAEIVIGDRGTWRSPPTDPGDRGRGVHLMHALADHAEITSGRRGTTVTLLWALPIPLPPGQGG